MPIAEMKADLFFVAGLKTVYITPYDGEAARKYAELMGANESPIIWRLVRGQMRQPGNPIVRMEHNEIVALLSGLITGVAVAPVRQTSPDPSHIPIDPAAAKKPLSVGNTILAKAGIEHGTSVGRDEKSGHAVYREMNMEILRAIRDLGGVASRKMIFNDIFEDKRWLNEKASTIGTAMGAHFAFLVEKKAIERIGKARASKYRLIPKPVSEAPKSDPEEDRKAHEAVMSGAH